MVNLTKKDVKELVDFIEFFTDKESTAMVSTIMKKFGITFEEYRILSELAMPSIRKKNEMSRIKAKATYYKSSRDKFKKKLDTVEEELEKVHQYFNGDIEEEENIKKWLDEYFKPEEPPIDPIVRVPEEDDIVETDSIDHFTEPEVNYI